MTSLWGPKYWTFFHKFSTLYPDNPSDFDKAMALTFLMTIKKVLPCPSCSRHYSKNLSEFTIRDALKSKYNFVKWFVDFHNYVNMSLKKKVVVAKKSINNLISTNDNIIQKFIDILEFMDHALPKKGSVHLGHVKAIQRFFKSVIYFMDLGKYGPFNLEFSDVQSFKIMKKNFIEKIKQ
jgi:hypothetical protein